MAVTGFDWDAACRELAQVDPVLSHLIEVHRSDRLRGSGNAFQTLVNAIVGQQISVAAADHIWRRLRNLRPTLSPENILTCTPEELRGVGLSRRKADYVRGIAEACSTGRIEPSRWESMDDSAVRHELTSLRGVGPWTAHMVLIFFLHRPDILPLEDIGLVNGASRRYGWDMDKPLRERAATLHAHAECWRPWRTVATWYIWRDIDADPVIY